MDAEANQQSLCCRKLNARVLMHGKDQPFTQARTRAVKCAINTLHANGILLPYEYANAAHPSSLKYARKSSKRASELLALLANKILLPYEYANAAHPSSLKYARKS